MHLARIEGNATASIGHPSLKGSRLLICQPINEDGISNDNPCLTIDSIGAGLHSTVFITSDGSLYQERTGFKNSPLRNMVFGIVDEPKQS